MSGGVLAVVPLFLFSISCFYQGVAQKSSAKLKERNALELEMHLREELQNLDDPIARKRKLASISEMLQSKMESVMESTGWGPDDVQALLSALSEEYGTSEEPKESESEQDHYRVLGLERNADASAIKRAYRRLALDAHPDKVPKEEYEAANKRFQQIALAYEVLSNPTVKTRYDQTGSSESQYNQQMDPNDRYYMPPEVERQQVRPKEVRSFKQFKKGTMDPQTRRWRKSYLVALVDSNDQGCLEFAAFGLKFPYPFAGWKELYFGANSSGLNLWWEDLVQTITVQTYDRDLVHMFEPRRCPTIILTKKGEEWDEFSKLAYERLDEAPNNDIAGAFKEWFWERMRTRVSVHNSHHSAVQLFEMQNHEDAQLIRVLQPGERVAHMTSVSFEIFAREDGTEGYTLSKNAVLSSMTVMDFDPKTEFIIKTRCADNHGDCRRMIEESNCQDVALSMTCTRSCGLCRVEEENQYDEACHDNAQHCDKLKEEGHCNSNHERMLSLCPLACGKCANSRKEL